MVETHLDAWCLESKRQDERCSLGMRGWAPGPGNELAVEQRVEDKDLLVCTNSANISKAFRSLPRENKFFCCCLSFKVLWEKPEVVYLKKKMP